MRWALPLLALVAVGCYGVGSKGASGGGPVALKDAPPPTVPAEWSTADLGVGFTLSFPPGWEVKALSREEVQKFVEKRNENAWDILERQKADVDLDTVKALFGGRAEFTVLDTMQPRSAEQALHALREETGRELSLDEAVARWRDTIYGGSNPPEMKLEDVKLPVGTAKMLWYADSSLGIIDKVTVFFLVDGTVQYTLFFGETAMGGAEPIPTREIMETFRPAR
jgi:hypothetical protein